MCRRVKFLRLASCLAFASLLPAQVRIQATVPTSPPAWALLQRHLIEQSSAAAIEFARRYLAGADSLAVAAGSQVSAALALALPAWWAWPALNPPLRQWLAALALALFCTGIAYVLYFRLIARIGPARAIAVTFLVPAFAMLWASVFLGEAVTPGMLALGALILLGTGLATGVLRWPARWQHGQ